MARELSAGLDSNLRYDTIEVRSFYGTGSRGIISGIEAMTYVAMASFEADWII